MRRHGRATIVRDTANQEKLRMVDLRIRNRRTQVLLAPGPGLWKIPLGGGEETKIVEGTWPVTPSRLSPLELHDLRGIVCCCLQ